MKMRKLYSSLVLFMAAFYSIEAEPLPEKTDAISSNAVVQVGEEEYQMGLKCFTDPNLKKNQAFSYFQKAVDKGHIRAHVMLGNCYLLGHGVAKDEQEGTQWFKKGAELGDPEAQWALGMYYVFCLPISARDNNESFMWFKKAGENSHINAQYNVGLCYEKGKGVAQDDKEALFWFKKAADQGYQYAQFKVGNYYEEGRGTDQDVNEAIIWYKKAADLGHRESQIKLKELGQIPSEKES